MIAVFVSMETIITVDSNAHENDNKRHVDATVLTMTDKTKLKIS